MKSLLRLATCGRSDRPQFLERQGGGEAYEGTASTLGLDIGATSGGQLTWAAFAPTTLRRAALAGSYVGATASGTVGAGVGANLLVGGSDRTEAWTTRASWIR